MLPNTNSNPQNQSDQPNPSVTPGDDSSEEVKITKGQWQKVEAALGRIAGLQSEKDIAKTTRKELTQLRDDMRPLLERAHTLGTQNKSLDEALEQIQTEQSEADLRSTMTEILGFIRGGGALPEGKGMPQGVDLTAALAGFDLDPKDTFVASQLQGKTFASQVDAEAYAGKIFRDKVKAPNPKPSQEHTTPSTSVSTTESTEELEEVSAEYLELFKEPSKNRERLTALAQRMKELGG